MDWLANTFGWMYWTGPSAVFFLSIFGGIALIGVFESIKPNPERKGFWPIPTRRGDRLFIGIISMIAFFLLWLGFVGEILLPLAALISAIWFVVQFRWG